ncbi:MAG: HD domain-containing protein, partial [Marinirhabdus sp.]
MKHQKTLKIINDPVYGFITVPTPFLCKLIEHPYVQRLRRIAQMGMGFLVYPGACHTRFQHALGALHLMQRAVETLRFKGTEISGTEAEALYAAILLHDVGHGPFSHAMERSVVGSVGHEELSVAFMRALNKEYNGKLTTAIRMFNNKYPRAFFHQLISGQLDVDRMDYLKRDSFYTGVAAGSISAKRLIAMLRVHGDQLVVEEKAVYSVEKFIIARRLMYWQVYLHKTGLVAEQLLVRLLQRAKQLVASGKTVPTSGALGYFLKLDKNETSITKSTLSTYALLDDADIFTAMKTWQSHEDLVLSKISTMLLNRDLLK